MEMPLLWHIPLSHYNEKVRWALDHKRIAHRRQVLGPNYLFRAWRATRRGTLPILNANHCGPRGALPRAGSVSR
jgi:glutathione S-transferase